jgi:signal transduction histidine kinase
MSDPQLSRIVDLVRRVRHDATNPITAVLGHVHLLLEDPSLPEGEVRASLRVIDSEVHRLADILRQLDTVRR